MHASHKSFKVLVTGSAGSGKSALAEFFKENGKLAIDADSSGIGIWLDKEGREVNGEPYINSYTNAWSEKNGLRWNWDGNKLKAALDKNPEVYLFGSAWNMNDFLDLFDKKCYLDADASLVIKRIEKRNREGTSYNDWGRTDAQRAKILGILRTKADAARKNGFEFIDASLPMEEIFRRICGN